MGQDEDNRDLRLSEAQFRKVIELATRITPSTEGISLGELRRIALELDIDQEALNRALQVVLATPPRARPVKVWLGRLADRLGLALDWLLPQRGRLVGATLVGGFLGWLSAFVGSGLREVYAGLTVTRGSAAFVDIPVFIALTLLTIANSLSRRLDGHRGRYMAETAATWLAFAFLWSVTRGEVTDDLLRTLMVWLPALGTWGLLSIRHRPGSLAANGTA